MGGQKDTVFYSRKIFVCRSGDLGLNLACHPLTNCGSVMGHVTLGNLSGPICKLQGVRVGGKVENGYDIMVVCRIK